VKNRRDGRRNLGGRRRGIAIRAYDSLLETLSS
jgi:hypothetical protein